MPEFLTVEQIFLRVRRRCRNDLGRPNEAFYSPDMPGFDGEQQAGMATNRANWDSRVPIHTGPDGYRIDGLVENPAALTDIVNFDRSYLGDLTGVDLVHLQCHVGTDTIALARLGASITGLDFSPAAIVAAKDLAARCDIPARFVEGNVYDAPEVLGQTYDMVYTGIGAINWLPDIAKWATVVAALLKPGGRFHITEGHPQAMIFSDDATQDDMKIEYPYFEGSPPMRWTDTTTYGGPGEVTSPESVEWAHNMGAIIQALIDAGLVIDRFDEHKMLAWEFLPWMEPVEGRDGWVRFPEPLDRSIPLQFTIQAHKAA